MVHVTVVDVKTILVLKGDTIIPKLLRQHQVVHILFVLVEFMDVVLKNVWDVRVVQHM